MGAFKSERAMCSLNSSNSRSSLQLSAYSCAIFALGRKKRSERRDERRPPSCTASHLCLLRLGRRPDTARARGVRVTGFRRPGLVPPAFRLRVVTGLST